MSATVCRPSGDLVVKVPASERVDDDPLSSTRSSPRKPVATDV